MKGNIMLYIVVIITIVILARGFSFGNVLGSFFN